MTFIEGVRLATLVFVSCLLFTNVVLDEADHPCMMFSDSTEFYRSLQLTAHPRFCPQRIRQIFSIL